MIVAFLDILGFTELLKTNPETASDSLNTLNMKIQTARLDEKIHPVSEYENDKLTRDFVKKSYISSFENLISFSDSLVIGATDIDLFFDQLMYFVASIYINTTEPFRKPFNDINGVVNINSSSFEYGAMRNHNAAPLLFRGGLSLGEDVAFFDGVRIHNSEFEKTALNVVGNTYVKAVGLEKSGKGPHLFCDQSVIDKLSAEHKKYVRYYDKAAGIYEIVWTKAGCETCDCSSDKWENVKKSIYEKMLPAAVNLYNYYCNYGNLKPYYQSLLDLVSFGIIKYSKDECNREDEAQEMINNYLSKHKSDDGFLA